ncbi:TIGR02556 family CRISPR-associated protein [Neobacillus sp. OS1-32]|uniref:TIGR02556 family CRISPR-associated protein n=1 Tax=Neobacillus sp. OS1-32 TaxID=3070682 RepID=UPI0027E0A97B|nr:TIGR02556 family CRISPR-associated protein [Neobacillus sp. OS1-32]WML28951.1 TIGR02556 family CRISPR-associated protein [Neobacillus sp. OS1-32]
MIKTVYELGSYYLAEHPSILEGLAVPISLSKEKEQYLVVIDLDTNKKKIVVTPYQMSSKTYSDYRYIGAADGAASPQWYGTVRNIDYFFSQTIPNLLERWEKEDPFYQDLEGARKIFFEDLGLKKSSEKRYQFILNPQFFNANRTEKDNKKALKEVTKYFEKCLKEEIQINPKDVLLYSLAINGKLIVSIPKYEELVLQEKFNVFDNQNSGICAITNKTDLITGETTKFKFNYYINDKINFASDIDKKNYVKNMAIGQDAYKKILVGETYILRKFNTRFNTLPCIVVPEFLFDINTQEDIPFEEFSDHIMDLVYTVQTLKAFEKLEDEALNYRDYSGIDNHVSLNFLFYTKAQASMKVNKYLANIPVNHLKHLQRAMLDVQKTGNDYFGNGNWDMGLNQLYYLIPMKVQNMDNFEKRKILLLYESLLSKKVLSYDWLIQQFLTLAKTHMFEQYSLYQIGRSNQFSNDVQLVFDLLRAQLLLKMLRGLNLISKGGSSSVEYQLEDENLVNYMKEMSFNHAQSSLFLLGVLIAKIGVAQKLKHQGITNENAGTSNKPILNKINFHGMNKMKLQMLSVEVFEKLRQVKSKDGRTLLNTYNEMIFAEHKRLLDKSLGNWKLSDRENVFYILSGYAFGTKRSLTGKKKSEEEEKDSE